MSRLVIITEIISPYRIPLFNALAERNEIDLHVIFLAETDPGLRQWHIYKDEIKFSYEVLPSWRRRIAGFNVLLNRGIARALRAARPDVILCGGYSYLASWQALFWARKRGTPFLLWSESNLQDQRQGHIPVEFLKSQFLRQCSGFVVPGKSALEYLLAHNIQERAIFTAVNAVDNDLFTAAASSARQNAVRLRAQFGLPTRYFLFAGRLVREKGVFELLSSYAKLEASIREQVGLIFVGDGAARQALERQASAIVPGTIRFAGFVHREQLPVYYALADMLILPTHTEPWGLVVNEAMACGLPVILSRVAGCAPDLITEGWNGHLIQPKDVDCLAAMMQTLATQPDVRAAMGSHSVERISQYSPAFWSTGILAMTEGVGGSRD